MKKHVFLSAIIGVCLVILSGCGIQNFVLGLKKKSPGLVNVSFRIPKNWKSIRLDEYIEKYYLGDEEFSSMIKVMEEKFDLKFCGYMCKESPLANITMFRVDKEKFEKFNNCVINDSYDYAKRIEGESGGGRGLKKDKNGITRWEGSGEVTYYSINKKYLYWVNLVVLTDNIGKTPFGGWYDSELIGEKINESIKFNSHGFTHGLIDGFFIIIKAPAHLINRDVRVFATANNGFSYILAFVLGILAFLVIILMLLAN